MKHTYRPVKPHYLDSLEPDNYPSVEEEPLSQSELAAKAHWEEFLPSLVQQLHAQGPNALETAVRAAWWRREYLINLTLAQNPNLQRGQVVELFQDELYPPPEVPATPAPPRRTTS